MFQHMQRNFLFIWIVVLLGIAIVLTLTLSGCAKTGITAPVEGKATAVLDSSPVQDDMVCSDSDSGISKEVKGVVTANGMRRTDKCFGEFLVEYYCDEGKIANQNLRCECSEGKCA